MKKLIAIIAMLGYACPFVYVAMFVDYSSWSMAGYVFMLIVSPVLAVICNKAWGVKALILGNLLSFAVSYYFVGRMEHVGHWGGYFTPLTPVQLLVFVSVCMTLFQLVAVKLTIKKMTKNRI